MADVLGLPLGTLKSRLFRARLALRDELRGYLDGRGT
jgi:DNA-directed RNA polymerase specialized sigma24 family protein